jgi:hypothetical protein
MIFRLRSAPPPLKLNEYFLDVRRLRSMSLLRSRGLIQDSGPNHNVSAIDGCAECISPRVSTHYRTKLCPKTYNLPTQVHRGRFGCSVKVSSFTSLCGLADNDACALSFCLKESIRRAINNLQAGCTLRSRRLAGCRTTQLVTSDKVPYLRARPSLCFEFSHSRSDRTGPRPGHLFQNMARNFYPPLFWQWIK